MATISNADNLPNLAILKQITTVPGAAYGRNALINGDFQINQRFYTTAMLSSTTLNNYYHDRWQTPANGFWNYAPAGSAGPYGSPGVRMYRTSGSTNQSQGLYYQTLSQNQSRGLQGKFVTVSFWVRVGSTYTGTTAAASAVVASLHYGTGTTEVSQPATGFTGLTNFQITNPSTLTTTAQYVTYTTASVIPTTMTQMAIRVVGNSSGTAATANDYIEFFDVQLEEGTAATPYQRKSFEDSLVQCAPYFRKSWNYIYPVGSTNSLGAMFYPVTSSAQYGVVGPVHFGIPMRNTPTVKTYGGPSATPNSVTDTGGNVSGGFAPIGASSTGFNIQQMSSSFSATGGAVAFQWAADNEIN
jgi:hypothetical protein